MVVTLKCLKRPKSRPAYLEQHMVLFCFQNDINSPLYEVVYKKDAFIHPNLSIIKTNCMSPAEFQIIEVPMYFILYIIFYFMGSCIKSLIHI